MNTQIKRILAGALFLLPLSLTATTAMAQLVYTPLDGCRAMDTRVWGGDGANTNPVPISTAVDASFMLADITLQGGQAANCGGVDLAGKGAYNITLTIVPTGSTNGFASLIPWSTHLDLWAYDDVATPAYASYVAEPRLWAQAQSGDIRCNPGTPPTEDLQTGTNACEWTDGTMTELQLIIDQVPTLIAMNYFRTYNVNGNYNSSSSINFSNKVIANTTVVNGCDGSVNDTTPEPDINGCDFDVRVFVRQEAHVVLDILGYYE